VGAIEKHVANIFTKSYRCPSRGRVLAGLRFLESWPSSRRTTAASSLWGCQASTIGGS